MAQDYVLEAEVEGGSDGEMAEHEAVWLAAVLVEEDEIGDSFSE